ncbi:hypothetical protein B0H21DRAFT_819001 [Amylocystis lapponica]|nr:hypothetical protein B0H21DRAFT_819001 [Amylocystis lapponica]
MAAVSPISSWAELKAHRTPTAARSSLRATDCLCLSPFAANNSLLWVSSPNMSWVPEIPMLLPHEPIIYYGDGMLGKLEFMKWPQAYYDVEPHCIAAPLHRALCQIGISDDDAQGLDFPLSDARGDLSVFNDPDIAWDIFTHHDVDLHEHQHYFEVGSLRVAFCRRLGQAVDEVERMAGEGFEQRVNLAASEAEVTKIMGEFAFQGERVETLRTIYEQLRATPMSTFDIKMWFREFQRVLLELRAFVIYHRVVRRRLDDSTLHQPWPVLPLRGVITQDVFTVKALFWIGVPVWYIRPRFTLTSHTIIIRIRTQIPAAGLFSTKKFMSHHGHVEETKQWLDAPQTQALRGNAQDKLRRFTQMSRVVLQPLKVYSLERVSQYMDNFRAARKSGVSQSHVLDVREANGPEQPEDVNEDAGLFDSQEPLVPSPADTLVMQQYGSGLAQDHPGSRNEPVVGALQPLHVPDMSPPPPLSSPGSILPERPNWVRSDGNVPAHAGRKGKKAPGDAETPLDPSQLDPALRSLPAWAPQIAPGWRDLTLSLSALARHPNSAILYALPPLHIFYMTPRTMAGERIHNWLRIRTICFGAVLSPPGHRSVLMTAAQWKVALQGQYMHLDDDMDGVLPHSHPADIEALPQATHASKRRRVDADRPSAQGDNRRQFAQRRLADRVDINVRFGVYEGLAPYASTMIEQWGEMSVSREDADTRDDLAGAVMWELSVFHFRLQLLALDRELAVRSYLSSTAVHARPRERVVMDVWGGYRVRPMWEDVDDCDPLGAADWRMRKPWVMALGHLMQQWPSSNSLPRACEAGENEDAYLKYERNIFQFYAVSFHRVRGHLPVVPLSLPSSVETFRAGAIQLA